MEIDIVNIGTNRYAPEGSSDINMYAVGESGRLTIGQLAIAVSLRSAAASEAQSVVKMNITTANANILSEASSWLQKVANGSADWGSAKSFAVNTLGVEASALPDDIKTYAKRMQAASAMKNKMETLVQQQQQDMIDLQTLVNRRDVAYSTSSNIVRTLGTSMSADATNF